MLQRCRILILLVALSGFMVACSSKPAETYVEHFFTYKNNQQKNAFTYILYLGEAGNHTPPNDGTGGAHIPQRQANKTIDASRKKSKRGSADDFMSLSFRMEEEAFKRLQKRLQKEKFCDGEIKYDENEYTWLRYTIKGYCQPLS